MNRIFLLLSATLLICATARSALSEPSTSPPPTANTKTFQDWIVRCPTVPQPMPCDAVQLLIEPQSKQRILSISVAYDAANAKNVVRIVLPLGVWLPNGVTIVAGDTKIEKVVVRRCEAFGCIVEGLLDPKLQESMRKGGAAKIVIFDQTKKPLDLKFSLAGFGAAQDYMVEETKKVKLPETPKTP